MGVLRTGTRRVLLSWKSLIWGAVGGELTGRVSHPELSDVRGSAIVLVYIGIPQILDGVFVTPPPPLDRSFKARFTTPRTRTVPSPTKKGRRWEYLVDQHNSCPETRMSFRCSDGTASSLFYVRSR